MGTLLGLGREPAVEARDGGRRSAPLSTFARDGRTPGAIIDISNDLLRSRPDMAAPPALRQRPLRGDMTSKRVVAGPRSTGGMTVGEWACVRSAI